MTGSRTSPVNPRRAAPWRRPLAALATFVVVVGLPLRMPFSSRIVLAYTLAVVTHGIVLLRIMARPRRGEMMEYAARHASTRWVMAASGVLSVASLAMLGYLVRTVPARPAAGRPLHVFVSLAAVILTWMVINGAFALRYAAIYYAPTPNAPDRPRGGLRFPDDDLVPDYWDFLYYAFTIGMCYQTSDISLVSPEMRRQTLVHGLLAFLYVAGIFSMLFGIVVGLL